jgi:ATP-dependent Clp protease ATP-binding subunit ClpX
VEFKLGARGLRSICEAVLSDAMFEMPGKEGVNELRVTAEYAKQRFDDSDQGRLKVAS